MNWYDAALAAQEHDPQAEAGSRRRGRPTKREIAMRTRKMTVYLGRGLSQREIAKRLGISRTSVQKRMRRK